jgi:membrane fusion protein, multidrug efflux system
MADVTAHRDIPSIDKKSERDRADSATRPDTDAPSSLAWLWILLVLVGGGILYYFFGPRFWESSNSANSAATSQPSRSIPVVAVPVKKGDMNIYLQGLGYVTAFNTVVVRSRVDGNLDKVAFVEGQMVHEGDLLAEIDPRPFQVQLEQSQGQLARDEAQLKNAQLDLQRYTEAGTAVPKQQLDTAQATVNQDEGVVKSDQANVDNAKLNLVYAKITAPLSGRIGLRTVDQGNLIHASDPNGLAVITQLQPISVIFSLREDDLAAVMLKVNNGEHLVVDAYDHDLTTKLATGTLAAVDNQVDVTTAMGRFKAVFANENNVLFPNEFVNVKLLIDVVKDAIIAPAAAIQRGPDASTFVYVVKSDETVELRNVTAGATEGDLTIITSGLKPGEVVVTEGVDKLVRGSKVGVQKQGSRRSSSGPATDESSGGKRHRSS